MNEFDFSVLTAGKPAQFGKYGSLRLRYLKENKPTLYHALLQGHLLNAHLNEIDQQAHEVVEQIAQQLIRSEQFDESVKLSNPILWVQKMNSFKDIAEETIISRHRFFYNITSSICFGLFLSKCSHLFMFLFKVVSLRTYSLFKLLINS